MQFPIRTGRRMNDTTPPSVHAHPESSESSDLKSLMSEMASLFPKLPPQFQEQARQAHAHVQYLLQADQSAQANSLLTHMRDVMKTLITAEHVAPLPFKDQDNVNNKDSSEGFPALAVPPLPPSTSHEIIALQRSLEELHMKVQEGSAVTLIAKRVRDMELDQKYFQLDARLKELKVSVSEKLNSISSLTDTASFLARKEVRKRIRSKNPFCEHEVGGFCEFCVGREFDDPIEYKEFLTIPTASRPPISHGPFSEEVLSKETVIQMQESLKTYQATLKNLLLDRKRELENL